MMHHTPIGIIGAGPAGMRAALLLADAGHQVTVIDDNPQPGGQIWRALPTPTAQTTAHAMQNHPRITFFPQTSVIAPLPEQRLLLESPTHATIMHYEQLILATGARERLMPFAGWTLPGVMGIGGLQALVKTGFDVRGQRIVIAGSGPLIWPVAHLLQQRGAQLVAIAERQSWQRLIRFGMHLAWHPHKAWQALAYTAALARVPIHTHTTLTAVAPSSTGLHVTLQGRRSRGIDSNLVAIGEHLTPNTELAHALGCTVSPIGIDTHPDTLQTSVANVYAIGEARGIGGLDCALADAALVAAVIAHQPVARAQRAVHRERRFATQLAHTFAQTPPHTPPPDTIICRCEDVTHAELVTHTSWRSAKLQTRCGMGPCQGRICGVACNALYSWGPDAPRPPLRPARASTLALLEHESSSPPAH